MLNMKIDNPEAFRFIMQEEIYLLDKDKPVFIAPAAEPASETNEPKVEPAQLAVAPRKTVSQAPAPPSAPAIQTPANEFNYLGANNKNFLVLVNYTDHEHIAPGHLTALESILKRKDLQMDDVAILNINKYGTVKLSQL